LLAGSKKRNLMGLGDVFKKATKSIGSATQKVVDPLNLSKGKVGDIASGGGLSDILLGRQSKEEKAGYIPLDKLQVQALGKYGELLNKDTNQLASAAIERNDAGIRAAGDDATRQAQALVAQRGLGSSSVGLNAILNQKRDMGEKLAANRAGLPQLQYDMGLNNLNSATNGLQNIFGSRLYKNGTPTGPRQGGLLPLIGAGVGAAYGGPQGAAAGYGLGNAFANYG